MATARLLLSRTFPVFLLICAADCVAQIPGSITILPLPSHASGPAVADSGGNIYTATAGLSTWPVTPGAAQTQPGCTGNIPSSNGGTPQPCTDAYLTKVGPGGNTVYATFLGGPQFDAATALAIDSAGDLYVVGTTGGSFPTTANAALPASPQSTCFAAKLSRDGTRFLYATYLPPAITNVSGLAVDSLGTAYIAGYSADSSHVIVTSLSADGSAFGYTKTIGGSARISLNTLLADGAGNVTLAGVTNSPDFPVTPGVIQTRLAGDWDGFAARLDASGNLVFATYLGGSGAESSLHAQIDFAGNVYLAGQTASGDFPTTSNALQPAAAVPIWNNAGPGGFLASLTPDAKRLRYSTFIATPDGAAGATGPADMVVQSSGDLYLLDAGLAGEPVSASAPQPCYNGTQDSFLAHFGPGGQLQDLTYLGLSASQIALPANNYAPGDGTILVISGTAGSGNTPAAIDVRFGEPGWTPPACLTPTALNGATLFAPGQAVAAGEVVSFVGYGIGPAAGVSYLPGPVGNAANSLAGVQVFFNGIAAPILYAQSRQVNAIVPVEMSGQPTASVTLHYQNAKFGPFTQTLTSFDPALFRWNPGVSTQAAAINQDGTINGPANPAPAGSIVSVWGTGFGPLTTPCSDGNLNVDAAVYLAAGYSIALGPASVLYAGNAPQLLCGAMQMNFEIPAGTPPGNFALDPVAQYQAGGETASATAPVGATVVVK